MPKIVSLEVLLLGPVTRTKKTVTDVITNAVKGFFPW
jgi:hypothetical protein